MDSTRDSLEEMTEQTGTESETAVVLRDVSVAYGGEKAVQSLSFEVQEGEIFCLLGPSGCGKTTTLKVIAGLEDTDEGDIYIRGDAVTENPPYSRDTSVVFQEWALFPRKTVLENVEFALRMQGKQREKRREKARSMLDTVGLSGKEEAYPDELSGGQKQRVALARSLVADPSVLLLDEPLSNLDEGLRSEMRLEILSLHEEFGKTTIHVTHDQQEAFTLADRVGVMKEGRLVQVGSPSDVYSDPETRFVEDFLGDTTFVDGTASEDRVETPVVDFEADIGDFEDRVEVSLRPEEVSLYSRGKSPDGGVLGTGTGEVVKRIDYGSTVRYHIKADGIEKRLLSEYSAREDPGFAEKDEVRISVTSDPPVFDKQGRRVL
jgi:spermidine/putrescine transport system ATP-binding protein